MSEKKQSSGRYSFRIFGNLPQDSSSSASSSSAKQFKVFGPKNTNPPAAPPPASSSSSSASSSSGEVSEQQFSICDIIIPKEILYFFLDNQEYGSDNNMLLDFIGSFQEVYETKEKSVKDVLYYLNRPYDLESMGFDVESMGFDVVSDISEIEIMTKIKEICLKEDKDKTIEDYFVIYDIQDDLCPNMYTRIYPDLFPEPKVEPRAEHERKSYYEFEFIRKLNRKMDELTLLSRAELVNYVTNFYNRIDDRINPNWLNNSRVNKPWYNYKNHQLKYNIILQSLYDKLTENNKKRLKNVVMRLRQGTLVRGQMTDTGRRPKFRNFNDEEMKILINEAKKLFYKQFSLADLNSDFEVDSASASASASAGPSASARPSASASASARPSASASASASAGPNDTTIDSINEMEGQSPYAILGLLESASRNEIKRAFFELARIIHPDKNRGNEDNATKAFKIISDAKDKLLPPPESSLESGGGSKKRKSIKKKKTSKKRKSLKKRKTLRK
jgi:hypothetical protein